MKTIVLLLVLTGCVQVVCAQVHIKNQYYVQLNVGGYDKWAPDRSHFFAQLEYGHYNRKLNSKGFAVLYARKLSPNFVPVEKYQVSFKQELNLFSSANLTQTFKVVGTVNFGYESINRDKPYFRDRSISSKSGFILALGTGIEYERTPIVIGTRITYNFLSNYQKFSTYPYVGIKFHLR